MTQVVKERPILFSGPTVRAILEGRKSQTRRLMKVQPIQCNTPTPRFSDTARGDIFLCPDLLPTTDGPTKQVFVECESPGTYRHMGESQLIESHCPYSVGQRLWVRETFRLRADQDGKPPSQDWWKSGAWYEADGNCEPSGCGGGAGKKRPAIFMPRWASRITLEITEVRVQRIKEITAVDIEAEGVDLPLRPGVDIDIDGNLWPNGVKTFREAFYCLWDSINAQRGYAWEKNPWVWAITFRRVA